MNNNDILRRLRYTFSLDDDAMMRIFTLAESSASRAEVCDWLKSEDDDAQKALTDEKLAIFLNGFIILKRGKKEGPQPAPELRLNNNVILRKLKIALQLDDEDMLEIFMLVGARLSKHELSAFFRKHTHEKYKMCKDQFLRNFLQGLQMKYTLLNK